MTAISPNALPAAAVRGLLGLYFQLRITFSGLVNARLRKAPALRADGLLVAVK